MKTLYRILVIASAAVLAFSCAKETDESSDSVQRRILEAYVEKYYPEAVKKPSGLYIIDTVKGTGRTPVDTSFVLVDYIISYLSGDISGYSGDSVARQLGEFSYSGYYDPRIWDLTSSTTGIVEIVTDMQEGGYTKAIIPAVLLDTESGMEISQGEGSSLIYEIYLRKVIDDIDAYQIEQLEEYAATYFPAITDSTAYGFYYLKTEAHPEDSLTANEIISIRYIGRYLNGTVFDTNIADTARKYRIYTSGGTYSASTYQRFEDSTEAMEQNSFIAGFNKALHGMTYGESAVTFFYSDLGYGDSGSDPIPGYVPLRFDIWVEPEEDVTE